MKPSLPPSSSLRCSRRSARSFSSAQAADGTPAVATVKVQATAKPTRHWLSDGLQGLSLLLPRHATQGRNNG